MRCVQPAGAGFSPLDRELGLLVGELSPTLEEGLVRLATWMPFEVAVGELEFFWRIAVSEATARRHAYAAGGAYVAVQAAEVERIEREQPAVPPGPAVQQVSADGAMVPLVGGEWAEVKTLAIGTVEPPRLNPKSGEQEVQTSDWSYFSRLTDAETFTRLALVEFHARGTERAGVVVAPMDGSEWLQGLLDMHRPDAVRVLDFPHALQHLAVAAQAVFGAGAAQAWLDEQAHTLKHGDPDQVLAALGALPTEAASDPAAAATVCAATRAYLEKRRQQLGYAQCRAAGYPIGSGSVESANKLVVQARLKGAGMHWAREHVNPLLALRTIACSGRWATAWPQIVAERQAQADRRRDGRRRARQPAPAAAPRPAQPRCAVPVAPLRRLPPRTTPTIVNGRPTAQHPWKQRPLLAGGRAHAAPDAKS